MAKTFSSLQTKEQTHFKIFNFYIRKKTAGIIVLGLIVLFIIIRYNAYKKQQELEQRILAQTAMASTETVTEEVLSLEEQEQRAFRERYGIPPEGFKWDMFGNLVALSDIEDMSAEDIVYTYVQAVHMMDLATAQRVAASSSIINLFDDYYSDITNALYDEDDKYDRALIRLVLDNLSIEGITNTVVQADGTYIFTMAINCLDLTNKDFWRDDQETLYKTMYAYDRTETDSEKKVSYVHDYVESCYEKQLCGFRTVNVDIMVGKANSGGWLVTDDSPLRSALLYEKGLDVSEYIMQEYNDWALDKIYGGDSSDTSEDVGFTHAVSENPVGEYDDSNYSKSAKEQAVVEQQLQEELDYYKEHGELPSASKSNNTDTTNKDTENTEEGTPTEETTSTEGENPTTTSGGVTEEERTATTQEQNQQNADSSNTEEHSEDVGEEAGYTHAD